MEERKSLIKANIFDFNGTLFIDNDKHIKAWNRISLLLRNKPIEKEELYTYFNGVPNKEIIYFLSGQCLDEERIHYYSLLKEKYYREYCLEDQKNFHLIKGAEEYLEKLSLPHTIASASIKENIDFFIKSFDLEKWFDKDLIIYDNGDYHDKKAMFLQASLNLQVPIEDCLIFEDSKSGIENAYACGCRHIIVLDTAGKGEEYLHYPGVIKVITDFSEL